MDSKKRWDVFKEIYAINKPFFEAVILLIAAVVCYGIYMIKEQEIAAIIYRQVHMKSALFFFDLINTMFLFLLGGLGLLAYQKNKGLKNFVLTNLFLMAGFAGVISNIYIYSFQYSQYQEIESMHHLLSVIERLFIAAMMFILIFPKDRRLNRDYGWIFSAYIPVMLFVVFGVVFQLADALPAYSGGDPHVTFLLTGFELLLCLYVFICGFGSVKRINGENTDFMTAMVTISVLFGFTQLLMMQNGEYAELNYLVFLIYKLVMLAVLIRSFYGEAIMKASVIHAKEEEYRRLLIENLQGMLDKNSSELKEKNRQVQSELEYARVIQQSLLPPESQSFGGRVHFESGYFPCQKLSGDFFDIFQVDEEHIAMYLLDVSGHGIPAALLTMVCNNFLRSSERLIQRFRAIKPHRSIQYLYEQFNRLNFPDEMHMVIFFANYNIKTGMFKYSSGGLNIFPVLIRKDGTVIELDDGNGFPICRLGGLFVPDYKSKEIQLKHGDTLIFCTDGMVDYEKNGLFTPEEMVDLVRNHPEHSLYEVNLQFRDKIYPRMGQLQDDVTYFLMRV